MTNQASRISPAKALMPIMAGCFVVMLQKMPAQDFTPARLFGETSPGLVPSFPVESSILKREQNALPSKESGTNHSPNDEPYPWWEGTKGVVEESMHPKRFEWNITLLGGWEYDDNPFLSNRNGGASTGGVNSYYARTPIILKYNGGHVSWNLSYIPEFRAYDGGGVGDTFNQAGSMGATYADEKLQLGLDADFAQTDGGSVEVGDRVDSIILLTSLTATYAVSPKTNVGASATFNDNDYQQYNSNKRYSGQGFVDCKVTPKTQLGIGAGYDKSVVDVGSDSEALSATGRISWQATSKISLRGVAGCEWRKYDDSTAALLSSLPSTTNAAKGNTLVSPIFSFGVLYNLSENTNFTLDLYRRSNPSISEINQSYYSTGIVGTVTQRIFDRINLSLSAGYENSDYRANLEGVAANRSDDYWFIRPQISYTVAKMLTFATYYQYSTNDSNTEGTSFSRNLFGATVSYSF